MGHDVKAAVTHNAAATFLPGGPSTYPAVKVAGVLVLAYVDAEGKLVISADFEESELGDESKRHSPTPVEVRMSGQVVWSAA